MTTKKGSQTKKQPKKVVVSYDHLRPTPAEIKQRCLEVQADWTPRERDKRAGVLLKDLDRPREVSNYRLWAKVESE